MVTRWLFAGFVFLLAAQRVIEMRISRRNEARILALGGREYAPGQWSAMKIMHTAWFIAMAAEVFLRNRPFIPALSTAAIVIFAMGQTLRYTAIRALGWRWSVRIMTLPGSMPVEHGIYRYIRHPNYLGVILEILAVPLLHSAYWTAIVGTIANSVLLVLRIRSEEKALVEDSSYGDRLLRRPRFFPLGKMVNR